MLQARQQDDTARNAQMDEALAIVVGRWREVLQEVENLVDSGEVLQQSDHLQDILFDDDTFSTSKRYFWAINLIHEAVRLLDDSIQQWVHYQRWSVVPWKKDLKGGREYYWHEKSQEVLANAERQGEEACEELRLLRQEFQEKLERITVMRDGLFNASAVMESRASTQLGENVKLLTFAIWSINESYSRTDLAIVTAIVAVATYSLTLNLNNLVRGLQKLYAPKRRALIEQMADGERDWERLAHRFKAFQRSEDGQRMPSEWMIAVFWGKRVVSRAGMVLRWVRLLVWRALRRLRVWGRRRESEETSDSSFGATMETVELGG
ncbi:hypothetical protein C8A01DRAFT_31772 [Parachaetomium inaequale]|uniref:Uncharacterized protein n=1 Tax=Parachaetomium inaequale TaxID=2588326 RepID=A0AAN6PN91_9PEZI|nr:hypothetical protein C8A01DRAFT_31772 [Parachaetomium inaequale]